MAEPRQLPSFLSFCFTTMISLREEPSVQQTLPPESQKHAMFTYDPYTRERDRERFSSCSHSGSCMRNCLWEPFRFQGVLPCLHIRKLSSWCGQNERANRAPTGKANRPG